MTLKIITVQLLWIQSSLANQEVVQNIAVSGSRWVERDTESGCNIEWLPSPTWPLDREKLTFACLASDFYSTPAE